MSDEEFVSILVPKDRVMDIYAYLARGVTDTSGATSSGEPVTDGEVVSRAYEESPSAMQRFLELLAIHPDEWLSIDQIRDELGMKTHQLPGALGAFQRRWQGRYQQTGRGPFNVDEADDGSRYQMPMVNAELVVGLAWTIEKFRAAMIDDADAVAVLDEGRAWAESHGGDIEFGQGPQAPMYLTVPLPAPHRAKKSVRVLALNHAGDVGVMYKYLKNHPPFDEEAARRDLTYRLNEIGGISIPHGRWNVKAFNVKLEFLRSPADRAAFFRVFDEVARRVAEPSSPRGPRVWNEEEFLEEAAAFGPSAERLARDTMEWNRRHGVEVAFGKGTYGPLYLQARAATGELVKIASVRTYSHAIVNYDLFKQFPPFDRVEERVELSKRLNSIPGVKIPERSAVEGFQPTIAPEALAPEAAQGQFLEVFDWVAARLLEG